MLADVTWSLQMTTQRNKRNIHSYSNVMWTVYYYYYMIKIVVPCKPNIKYRGWLVLCILISVTMWHVIILLIK